MQVSFGCRCCHCSGFWTFVSYARFRYLDQLALFSFSLCFSLFPFPPPHCPQIVRRQDAFLIASDGQRGGGGSTCTCCRCQFSNWTFVINFNGSAAQFSSVQSSPAHFSQCSPGVHRAGQDFHSDPSLRFASLALLPFGFLLCFVVAHAALLFMWHRQLFRGCLRCLFIVVGVASAAACGKVAFVVIVVVIVICQLIARCSAQRTAQSTIQSALVMRGQFVGSTYQEVSQFHCSVPSIVQLYFGFIWLYLAFAFTFTFLRVCLSLWNLLSSC